MDALRLDGNAVAGLLQEVFTAEMTTTIETCDGCGVAEPIGATHLYHAAGIVLRCPHCDNALLKIVRSGTRVWIGLPGIRTLQLAI